MQSRTKFTAITMQLFRHQQSRNWIFRQPSHRQLMVLQRNASPLFSKFTVHDPTIETNPLTSDRAYEILIGLSETERKALQTALDKYESQKVKKEFEGVLARTRWRSKFGRPAKLPALGDVDPTGSYCPVPDDWLRKKMSEIATPPSNADLRKLFLINAVPFLGFGFLDNFTMIICGDYIEHLFGIFMCISTMAAAALGNTISDILGIGSAYYVERLSEFMGLKHPKLTVYQLDMKSSRKAANSGRIFGITAGCILGMTPLLFMDSKKKKDDEDDEKKDESSKAINAIDPAV